jgi:peptidoglycan/LPS O-acetylase OafA/YrhL
VVGQAWTLYYEVIFYALFGLTIWKPRLGALLLGAWFLAAVASSLSSERVWNALREPLRLFVSPLNLLFGLGMAAAWALRRRPPARGGLLVGAGAAVFALAAAFAFMTGGTNQPAITHLGLGLGSALCVLGLAGLEREGRAKTPQFLVALGGASYSIYLTHTFALSFGARLLAPWRPQPFVAFVLLGVFALLAGWLFHRLIERPLLLWTRKGREPAAAAVV